jgi:hypothetical protein
MKKGSRRRGLHTPADEQQTEAEPLAASVCTHIPPWRRRLDGDEPCVRCLERGPA